MENRGIYYIDFGTQAQFIEEIEKMNSEYYFKNGKNKTYHIITYGCQMNVHDSEKLAGMLNAMGYVETQNLEEADLIIFNTCAVREHAESRVYGNIGPLKRLKDKKPELIIGVCGCMPQQLEVAQKLAKVFPFLDIIFGTKSLHKFPQLLYKAITTKKTVIDVAEDEDVVVEGIPTARREGVSAFVNIIYGCNNFCSYCIVPYVRGRERSRRPEEIIFEIQQLAANGVKEVTLLGQNVNSYGKDLPDGIPFYKLLEKVNAIEGIERIRFVTSHPKDLSDELIFAMRDLEKVCEHIHLPVQSGSTRILRQMNRHYTKEDYLRLVEKLKENIPDIAITTDIIVGFPGETEEDFEDTLDVVRKVEFDSAYTFIYSKRKGTKAAQMPNQVPDEVKHERFQRLVKLVEEIALKKNQQMLGKVCEILIDGYSKRNNLLEGRTRTNKVVNVKCSDEFMYKFVNVKILEASRHWLYGEVI
ncbi:tRNA-i(6)A37 thiotransferase enzyme MiaB [Caldicellulosiruptor saccharolyticus DSM 8903]|uniref:tRNA-2-methylthio-N(6)-dimethylallyladenosine synthase n=1 Tax=Caldicellulosiruptor saccharolyticus (strain ATCC 43494 / DSM 8903 / Tp8T 6331) TaxID=351627 RepID=MIAB_CALS8|nr:tRNA (N6-isopentenyl adenosine(37)-C2)-methylthiotransferase MiaB [Caldicellulosiruptor saccharolyticus]A4XL48.1 RecName: Full=tRNA-2-methylthio-N(6)-dimethylallyladenosine synthase; AltName: Full=(Dimethylallyl)adenosine tRNA methylthiotransferase MiaB; AltName: Full=tRNA-i(6)A37 methylthiotransferase [Caldicellulosiruptor saccharolyticus DSM 8903]ABP67633.1 tRNA-i(6)A37 thiotransferase enzyme MiaB [Caldicellulosiruptor saccharolyticus DSM 8903]